MGGQRTSLACGDILFLFMAGSAKGNSLHWLILYLLFSIFILIADKPASPAGGRGFLAGLHQAVQGFTIPVESRLFALRRTFISPFSSFFSTGDKDKRIQELEKENALLLGQLSQMQALKEENEKARYLLGASLPASWHFEPARVVSNFADRIYLTADFEPKQGTPVITSQEKSGVLIGQVESVLGEKIEVVLSTSDLFKTTVLVRDKETGARRAAGILVGRAGRLRLEQVLTSETVKEGDMVVTSGANLPPELLVGYVTKVLETKGAFREAEVEYPLDLTRLDYVFLVTKW